MFLPYSVGLPILQLNAPKTEFIRFGSRSALLKIPQQFHQLTVGTSK